MSVLDELGSQKLKDFLEDLYDYIMKRLPNPCLLGAESAARLAVVSFLSTSTIPLNSPCILRLTSTSRDTHSALRLY